MESKLLESRPAKLRTLDYVFALLRLNVRTTRAQPMLSLISAVMMIGNNLIVFSIWFIYFAKFSTLGGWQLTDMGMLIGVVAWAFGLMVVFAGGVRDIAQTIVSGGLDIYLGRPRHPLPGLLLSRSIPSGIGDLVSALVFWLVVARVDVVQLGFLIVLATAAAVIMTAILTITQCIVFWRPRAQSLCEDLFNMLLMTLFYPQHAYGLAVRLALLTVFPTALIALFPVEAVREGSVVKAAVVAVGAVVYAALAKWTFDRGVRAYSSGNRMLELR
jgi:ABC-2 type transport system permease protein